MTLADFITSIRDYKPEDFERVKQIHQTRGYGFVLPNLEHPLMVTRKVLADEQDRVIMCVLGRIHINAILLVDGTWGTPETRLAGIVELQNEAMKAAGALGLDIATTQADGRFAERLKEMGWQKGFQEMWYRSIP
jgi:hypothetical protein